MSRVYVKPWNDEIKRILDGLTRKPIMYTNYKMARDFSRRYPELVSDFLDITTTRYGGKKQQKTIFSRPDNIVIVPEKKKFFFHKIF